MATNFTTRFYSVHKKNMNALGFVQALKNIDQVRRKADRERELMSGYIVRLERFETEDGYICGEMVRVRDRDYPFEILENSVGPLNVNNPIGNGVAFRFRIADSVLAIQYDVRIISPGRFIEYIYTFDACADFSIKARIDARNWARFMDSPLRKIRIGIAQPSNLTEIEDASLPVASAMRHLGQAYEAPIITLEMGMGHNRGSLPERTKAAAKVLFERAATGETDLRTLKGYVKPDDYSRTDEIDLIDEFFSEKEVIEFPKNDPDAHYTLRKNFLRTQLSNHV